MQILTSGQITIVDMYDAPALNAWISATEATAQTYNNTTLTYNPNYSTKAQTLKLNLTRAGSTTSLLGANVSNVKWTKRVGSTTTEVTSTVTTAAEYKSSTSNSLLTTKANTPIANNAVTWEASGTWYDENTGLDVNFSATIQLTVIQLAKAAVIANIYAPNGDTFRNETPASLSVNLDLYKDGDISSGSRKYKWFAYDTSVTPAQDTDAGIHWRKITKTTGTGGEVANVGFDVATTDQGVLTVYPDSVVNANTYLCVTTDNAGGTSGTKMRSFITLRDMDDPVMAVIESSGGNILKNGLGSTVLTARLYRNGNEMTSAEKIGLTYRWYKIQDNVTVPNWGGTGVNYKTGESLSIGNSEINVKTTFRLEVLK